ncbi:PAS/PAC sensor signal transduction histidine kinase [Stanieria sp. NIES-3757]|nr:PAS/PAC sensor signal transduction histidine kinase [Stanieria sp. NIES-3757]
MAALEFLLGLIVGLTFFAWKQFHFKHQLQKILSTYSPSADWVNSLPPISLVRRELIYLNQQKKQLEAEKEVWQELIEQAPFGYLRVDGENQLLWCNQQARELLQIDRWQVGQIRLLLELVRSYELDQLIETTRQSQQPQVQEWVYYFTQHAANVKQSEQIKKSPILTSSVTKGVKSVALSGYSFPLPAGEVGIFILNRQPLIELSQQSDRTFSDLTHELRTPLTSISLVAENLLKRLKNPELRWVEQMLKETNRLINLVEEWLELSKLKADPSQILNYEDIELRGLLFSVWHILEPLANRKEISFNYCGEPKVWLQGDKSRLIQVFLNLLDNAIKHSPIQGQITIEIQAQLIDTSLSSPQIQIDIIDSGTGFEIADLPHVFKRLYRGDKSRTRQSLSPAQGSGLGLAIVQEIIDAHQGLIKAQNHPVTGGGWLQICLPKSVLEKKIDNSVISDTLPH